MEMNPSPKVEDDQKYFDEALRSINELQELKETASNSRLKMNSRYLIESNSIFKTTYLILTLQESGILVQSIGKNGKETVSSYEWSTVQSVTASESNQRQFTLYIGNVPLPGSGLMRSKTLIPKSQSAGKTLGLQAGVNRTQSSLVLKQVDYECNERDRLIVEVNYVIWCRKDNSSPISRDVAMHSTMLRGQFNDDYQDSYNGLVLVQVFPTLISLTLVRKRDSKLQASPSPNFAYEEQKQRIDLQTMDLEHLMQQDDNLTSQHYISVFGRSNLLMSAHQNQKSQNINDQTDTCLIGVPSTHQGIGTEQLNLASQTTTEHRRGLPNKLIYLSNLKALYYSNESERELTLVLQNQDFDILKFRTKEQLNLTKDEIVKSYRLQFKKSLSVYNESYRVKVKKGTLVYTCSAHAIKWEGTRHKVAIQLSEIALFEEDSHSNKTLQRSFQLADLKLIRISTLISNSSNLVMEFQGEQCIELAFDNNNFERDSLVSAILTLRNCITGANLDDITILQNSQKVNSSLLLHGLVESTKSSWLADYEVYLVQQLNENVLFDDFLKITQVGEEIILNSSMKNSHKVDQIWIQRILVDFTETLKTYLKYSLNGQNQPHIEEPSSLNEQGLKQSNERMHRYLNLMPILFNSKAFFAEIGSGTLLLMKDVAFKSRNLYTRLLASQALVKAISHYSGFETKLESHHKSTLIQKQVGEEFINCGTLGEDVKQFLNCFDSLYDPLAQQQRQPCSLSVYIACSILKSIKHTKQVSTSKDDLKTLIASFCEVDKTNGGFPVIDILDKFVACSSSCFITQYFFSMVLSELVHWHKTQQDRKLQDYILTYSVQFIYHLQMILDSDFKRRDERTSVQKLQSVKILCGLLAKNDKVIAFFVEQCLPQQSLLWKVSLHPVIEWTCNTWQTFFLEVINRNYESKSSEHWVNETRLELTKALTEEIETFIQAKRINAQVQHGGYYDSYDFERKNLSFLPSHCIKEGTQQLVSNRGEMLRWNHQEFRVQYQSLQQLCFVWKHYIVKLLNQGEEWSTLIDEPLTFWTELQRVFITSLVERDQLSILEAMRILYSKRSSQIGDIRLSMPLLTNIFKLNHYRHCRSKTLMVLLSSMSIGDDSLLTQNMGSFMRCGGLEILISLLKNSVQEEEEQSDDSICELTILSINILDIVFKKHSQVDCVPLPLNRRLLLQPLNLQLLVQLLHKGNEQVIKEMINFLLEHFDNHHFYYSMRHSGIIEVLLLVMAGSESNGSLALRLLKRFQIACLEYNSDIKFSDFSEHDYQMIMDENQLVESQFNTGKSSILETNSSKLKNSFFLRYLPIPMVKYLVSSSETEFLGIFYKETCELPVILWSSLMRDQLREQLSEYLNQCDWIEIEDRKFCRLIQYPMLDQEVRCGRYYLRVWASQEENDSHFHEIKGREEDEFLICLQSQLQNCIDETTNNYHQITTLFKACLFAVKRFKNLRNFPFHKIIIAMEKASQEPLEPILMNFGMKIVHEVTARNLSDYVTIIKISRQLISAILTQESSPKISIKIESMDIETMTIGIKALTLLLGPSQNCHQALQLLLVKEESNSQATGMLGLLSKIMEIPFKLLPTLQDLSPGSQMMSAKNVRRQNCCEKEESDQSQVERSFEILRAVAEFTKYLTKYPQSHQPILSSDFIWKLFKSLYFSLNREIRVYKSLKQGVGLFIVSLKNLISYNEQVVQSQEELQFDKEEHKNFNQAVDNILPRKLKQTLLQRFQIIDNQMEFSDQFNPRDFLNLFTIQSITSSELIWDSQTRSELLSTITAQLASETNFDYVLKFQYSINQSELMVEGIYLRHYNNNPKDDYRPKDVDSFASAVIKRLGNQIVSEEEEDSDNYIQLLTGFKNILSREDTTYQIRSEKIYSDIVDTLCEVTKVQNGFTQSLVYEILTHLARNSGKYANWLMIHSKFNQLLIETLYSNETLSMRHSQVILIIQVMLSQQEVNAEEFLVSQGLIFFMLNRLFTITDSLDARVDYLRILLSQFRCTERVYGQFLPKKFFVEMFAYNRELFQGGEALRKPVLPEHREILSLFLQSQFNVSTASFESVFVVWTKEMREKSHARIKHNCDEILKSYEDPDYQVFFDLGPLSIIPIMNTDIKVKDVIIRVYNKNSAVYVNEKLNMFIHLIAKELNITAILEGNGSPTKTTNVMDITKSQALIHSYNLLLTALLLSLEQLLFNDQNPNRILPSMATMPKTGTTSKIDSKFYHQIIEKISDQTQLDSEVFDLVTQWLHSGIFFKGPHLPESIKITFLQILILLFDVDTALKVFLEQQRKQILVAFISEALQTILDGKCTTIIEEFLILLMVHKVVQREPLFVPLLALRPEIPNEQQQDFDGIQSSHTGGALESLMKILGSRRGQSHVLIAELIIQQMASNLQYRDHVYGVFKLLQSKVDFISSHTLNIAQTGSQVT